MAAERLGFRVSTPVSDGASEEEIAAELARAWLIDRAWHDLSERAWKWLADEGISTESLPDDAEARRIFLGEFLNEQGVLGTRDRSDIGRFDSIPADVGTVLAPRAGL